MAKRSFFERLTGSVPYDSDEKSDRDEPRENLPVSRNIVASLGAIDQLDEEAELTVDVHQTDDSIIVKTMVAGVSPDDLDINITRDMVTIKGRRAEEHLVEEDDYFIRELYWGTFSRTIALPEEVDVEEAQALQRHGLLVITLPKIDKHKKTKLKVKSS